MTFSFCLSFANRASDSGDLYIDFNRNHLIYPAAYLVCQDYAWFILFLQEHAYALHTTSRISCHVHVLVVYYVVCLFPGCFPSLASVSFRICEDPFDYVRLSSSWIRSSSLRDLRQDDLTLEITSIF